MTARENLADRIEKVRFTPARFRGGYEMGMIDTLLDDLASRARQGQRLAPSVPAEEPGVVRFREGYRCDEVRVFLQDVLREARERVPDWLTAQSG